MTDADMRALISSIEPWMIDIRRALHRIPERGFAEFETQRLIQATLDSMGIPHESHRTGTIGLIRGAHDGPTVALRADIDALPIREPDGECTSTHDGLMHACGHDAHAAIQLGAARALNGIKEQIRGNVKLIFQPAEETDGGAQPMVAAGALEHPHVDAVYGLHVQPYLPSGTVETRAGALNASTDELNIVVRGRACHGAYPEQGADAILAAAQVISALHTITSRNVSPLQSAVITIGEIAGGAASNVLCGEVRLRGTIRATGSDMRQLLHARATAAAECAAMAMGCAAEVEIVPGYCALVNHDAPARRVLDIAARLLGPECALTKAAPSMGGEDFAYFILDTPGAFYHIGCTPPGADSFGPLHSAQFRLDDNCLRTGALMQLALALDALEGGCA